MNRVHQTILRLAAGALLVSSASVFAAAPTKSTTGPTTPVDQLRKISGSTITQDGTVLEGVYITGSVNVQADNVVIRNFKIETSSSYGVQTTNGATNLVLEDGEISGMSSSGVYGSNFTARRLYVHDSGGDAFKPTTNVTIEDSFVERLGYLPEAHADGVQMVSGSNLTVRGNNFLMTDVEGFRNSQVFMIQTNNSAIENVTIEGNWINGGGYSVQIRDKGNGYGAPANVNIRNNRFGRGYSFGPWVVDGNPTICGNVWDDTSALMDRQTSTNCSGTPPTGSKKPATPSLTSVQ